jgi:hypothetical protein
VFLCMVSMFSPTILSYIYIYINTVLNRHTKTLLSIIHSFHCRSRCPRGLRRRSSAAWLLGSRVRIPLRTWMFDSWFYTLRCLVVVEDSATR